MFTALPKYSLVMLYMHSVGLFLPLDEVPHSFIHLFTPFVCIKGVSQQMEWLLELMGHVRNIAYGGKSEPPGDTSAVCL